MKRKKLDRHDFLMPRLLRQATRFSLSRRKRPRESKLRGVLAPIRDRYKAVLIDSPPSLGLLTVNALVAADAVIVPIQCEYYALEGLGQLVRTIELVRDGLNPTLAIGGVVLTMFDARTRLAEQVVAEVRRHFGDDVFRTVIPRSVRLSEAPGFGRPITRYDPTTRGAQAYRDLTREFLTRWIARRPAPEPPQHAAAVRVDGLVHLRAVRALAQAVVDESAPGLAFGPNRDVHEVLHALAPDRAARAHDEGVVLGVVDAGRVEHGRLGQGGRAQHRAHSISPSASPPGSQP